MIMIIVGLILVFFGVKSMIWIGDVVFVFYFVFNFVLRFEVFGFKIFIFGVNFVSMGFVLVIFVVIVIWLCCLMLGVVMCVVFED